MASITVTPYLAGTVNHATNNEMAKITDSVYLARGTVMEREEKMRRRRRAQYCARKNRETADERESKLEARRARERRQHTMMSTVDNCSMYYLCADRAATSAAKNVVAVEKASYSL